MHTRRMSDESFTEDITDPNQRDRTLRALEGREDDYSRVTPPDSAADATADNENTAEIFMNIAREEPARRQEERGAREDQSAIVCIYTLISTQCFFLQDSAVFGCQARWLSIFTRDLLLKFLRGEFISIRAFLGS